MGHASPLGTIASLFVGGQVKGLYNPVEKLDVVFLNQVSSPLFLHLVSHLNLPQRFFLPENAQWDVIHLSAPIIEEGTADFFHEMRIFALNNSLTNLSNWLTFVDRYVDLENYIDYMLLNTYSPLSRSDRLSRFLFFPLSIRLPVLPFLTHRSSRQLGLDRQQRLCSSSPRLSLLSAVQVAILLLGRRRRLSHSDHGNV